MFFKFFILVLRVFVGFTDFTDLVRKIHIFRPNISLIISFCIFFVNVCLKLEHIYISKQKLSIYLGMAIKELDRGPGP